MTEYAWLPVLLLESVAVTVKLNPPSVVGVPLIARLFEMYATGELSPTDSRAEHKGIGLAHPRSGRRMMKAEIHRFLNAIYTGDFKWLGRSHRGSHEALISRELFAAVQAVLNRKRRAVSQAAARLHGSADLRTLRLRDDGRTKEGTLYVLSLHGFHGRCGNTYIRKELLADLLGDVVKRI